MPGNTDANTANTATYEPSSLQIHQAVSAWFLGPQAENAELLKDLFSRVVADHVSARTSYHTEDGSFITDEIKNSRVYERMVEELRNKIARLSSLLNDRAIPFYSPRYAAHMTFESSLPSIAGWLSAMLLNPNNVSFEAGPITTLLELEVGRDLCHMLGFDSDTHSHGDGEEADDMAKSWGHLTCDGTVANIEAIWAARNLKFYPLALRNAMAPSHPLHFISSSFTIPKCSDSRGCQAIPAQLFRDLSTWELLNLRPTDILAIPQRLQKTYGISKSFLESTLAKYTVQSTGMSSILRSSPTSPSATTNRNEPTTPINEPTLLIASTNHYSWPKGAALTGIGSHNLIHLPVDHHARIDIPSLRRILQEHVDTRTPVYAVVATIGTTEEGAVDPLAGILQVKEEFRKKGLGFVVHADAAWGGYFTSTLRDPPPSYHLTWPGNVDPAHGADSEHERTPFDLDYVPSITMKPYTTHQLASIKHADSVTIDPHKSGYCPYPAGGLCYRDGRMRGLLTWSAPYIQHATRGEGQGQNENIGVYGVEGSKPGAAAAAVYMHHSVVGLHKRGHGGLLGEVSFTCARIAAHWATMSTPDTPYTVTPFNLLRSEEPLPSGHRFTPTSPASTSATAPQRRWTTPNAEAVEAEKDFIRTRILGRSNEELVHDPEAMEELRALGSDLNINAFVCNFRMRVPVQKSGLDDTGTTARTMITERSSSSACACATPVDGCGRDSHCHRRHSRSCSDHDAVDTNDHQNWEWVLNDDVSEANYLNRLIFDRLSVTDLTHHPRLKTPMFLSSTVLRSADYGEECLGVFKDRAGLERESGMDLFVLRNVVMSPFQAAAGFVGKLADIFRETLEECLKHVVAKNTVSPQIHRFVVQGTSTTRTTAMGRNDRVHLVYRPTFHHANGRHQLILEVELPDSVGEVVSAWRGTHPGEILELWTEDAVTMGDALKMGEQELKCRFMAGTATVLSDVRISNVRIVKHRSLRSRYLDASYDAHTTPFYVYGTPSAMHIDHMLLKAPNTQISVSHITLSNLSNPITPERLQAGLLLYILIRPEAALQPFTAAASTTFSPGAEFEVMICTDPFPACARGPGLAAALNVHKHPVLARGTMRLPDVSSGEIFVDGAEVNREDFFDDGSISEGDGGGGGDGGYGSSERVTQRMSEDMNWEERGVWMGMVKDRLG